MNLKDVDLSDNGRRLLNQLADDCCSIGEAPVISFGLNSGNDMWNEFLEELSKTKFLISNKDNPELDASLWPQEWALGINLVNQQVKANHLYYFQNTDRAIEKIIQKLPSLADHLKDHLNSEYGMLPISITTPTSQFFAYQDMAIYMAPPINGMPNAALPLSILLCSLGNKAQITIRPDPFRIVPLSETLFSCEKERAYGKPFNTLWVRNLQGTEIAQHCPDFAYPHLKGGETTQFIWERKNPSEVQFACEELPYFYSHKEATETVSTRFMHGIYDIEKEVFSHFDGALHIYDVKNYLQRLSLTLKSHFQRYQKVKIFRVDSQIPPELAMKIQSSFFRWNTTASEYFSYHSG